MRLDSMVALAVAAEHDFVLSGDKARGLNTPEAWAQAVTEAHEAGWAAYKQALANGLDDWEASVAYGEARRKIFTIFG